MTQYLKKTDWVLMKFAWMSFPVIWSVSWPGKLKFYFWSHEPDRITEKIIHANFMSTYSVFVKYPENLPIRVNRTSFPWLSALTGRINSSSSPGDWFWFIFSSVGWFSSSSFAFSFTLSLSSRHYSNSKIIENQINEEIIALFQNCT